MRRSVPRRPSSGDYGFVPGTLIEARPIGVLEMIDGGKPDGKVLCVPHVIAEAIRRGAER